MHQLFSREKLSWTSGASLVGIITRVCYTPTLKGVAHRRCKSTRDATPTHHNAGGVAGIAECDRKFAVILPSIRTMRHLRHQRLNLINIY